MNIRQSVQLAQLRAESTKRRLTGTPVRMAKDVVRRVFDLAASIGEPIKNSKQAWSTNWIASKKFYLLDIPLNAVAVPPGVTSKHHISVVMAAGQSGEPIVVDYNRYRRGSLPAIDYAPPLIVVDGAERYHRAVEYGLPRIKAWVGEIAAQRLGFIAAAEKSKQTPVEVAPEEEVPADDEEEIPPDVAEVAPADEDAVEEEQPEEEESDEEVPVDEEGNPVEEMPEEEVPEVPEEEVPEEDEEVPEEEMPEEEVPEEEMPEEMDEEVPSEEGDLTPEEIAEALGISPEELEQMSPDELQALLESNEMPPEGGEEEEMPEENPALARGVPPEIANGNDFQVEQGHSVSDGPMGPQELPDGQEPMEDYQGPEMGSNEMHQTLQGLLDQTFGAIQQQNPTMQMEPPQVVEVFPMQKFFVFQYNGQTFRQDFQISPDRQIQMIGQPSPVASTFGRVNVPTPSVEQQLPGQTGGMNMAAAIGLWGQSGSATSSSYGFKPSGMGNGGGVPAVPPIPSTPTAPLTKTPVSLPAIRSRAMKGCMKGCKDMKGCRDMKADFQNLPFGPGTKQLKQKAKGGSKSSNALKMDAARGFVPKIWQKKAKKTKKRY